MARPDPDGAFFEDWSAWASLDDLPMPPRDAAGRLIVVGPRRAIGPTHKYYCLLLTRCAALDAQPGFELLIPDQARLHDMLRRVPGARRHPLGIASERSSRHWQLKGFRGVWLVPASSHQALRMVLPGLKAAVIANCRMDD